MNFAGWVRGALCGEVWRPAFRKVVVRVSHSLP